MAASSSTQPWEVENVPWELEGIDDEEGSGSEAEFDYEKVTAEEAEEQLFAYTCDLKRKGTISATQACTWAFWAAKAGAKGPIRELAESPEESATKASSRFSKKFDRVTGDNVADDNFYELEVPSHVRATASNAVQLLPSVPPLEAFVEEHYNDPTLKQTLDQALENRELPPNYLSHPVVVEAPPGTIVLPGALYVDGMPFVRHDSLIGFWTYCMLTGVRTLVAALRKSEVCKCGCKGWDSVYQVLLMLAWSFEALAGGKHPQTRHDGSAWGKDVGRSSLAGTELGFKVALVLVKFDLAELSPSFGFPSVASKNHPCIYCWESAEGLRNLRCLSSLGNGRQKTLEDLNLACERCETLIIVTDETFPKLRAALKPDRREQGHGVYAS